VPPAAIITTAARQAIPVVAAAGNSCGPPAKRLGFAKRFFHCRHFVDREHFVEVAEKLFVAESSLGHAITSSRNTAEGLPRENRK
jgi:hypothetical protein